MFKFQSVVQATRRSVFALLLAVGLVAALLPAVVQAAPLAGGQATRVEGGGCANQPYGNQWSCHPGPGRYGGPGMGYGRGPRMGDNMGPGWGHGMGYNMGSGRNVYVVQPGDTLSSIALRYGTSVRALMRMNQINNPNHIYAGEVLHIS